MKKCIALIPARSGSVRLRHKNLIQIQGIPLLAIAVQQALMLPEIDEVYISTDSEIYAEIAANYGAIVPFIRPSEISAPDSTDYEVFVHFLNWYVTEKGETPDLFVQMRATAPMRDLKLIQKAIRIMKEHPEYDSLRSVSVPHQSPYKMWTFQCADHIIPLLPEVKGFDGPTQALPAVYAQDGIVDIIRPATIMEKRSMSGDCIAGILNPDANWDIDNLHDLKSASFFFQGNDLFGMLHGTEFGGNLGIVQGRLTESSLLQCFPTDWKREFPAARHCGYHCIELIRDLTYNPLNPLYADDMHAVDVIIDTANQNGVAVRSICDDYVQCCDWNAMTDEQYGNLFSLLIKANLLNVSVIVYPMFQQAVLESEHTVDSFLKVLSVLAPLAKQFQIDIALEISEDSQGIKKLFRKIPWDNVGLCLDTGNLFATGYSIDDILSEQEIQKRLMHVHLKDRDCNGENVIPGKGKVNFATVFAHLKKTGYHRLLITETDRGDEPLRTAQENRMFFSDCIRQISS